VRDSASGLKRKPSKLALGFAVVMTVALGVPAASAQNQTAPSGAAPQTVSRSKSAQKAKGPYFVDFRARTAASYGHAFVWYGRMGDRAVEVAGLHPATDSMFPYILGHLVPVPSETGKSYGDLDEEYLTASYRVYLSAPEAKRVFAYIKQLQSSSVFWHAAVYNCVSFIGDIARFMNLRTPGSHLLYPEVWVNELRAMNSGSPTAAQAKAAPAEPVY
jgi:hypothetical protein